LIYASNDSGISWMTTTAPSNNWVSLVSSADGTMLVAAADNGIFASTDSGISWTAVPGSVLPDLVSWRAVASSADGGRVLVAGNYTEYYAVSSPPPYPNPSVPAFIFAIPYSGPWRLADLPAQSWDAIVSSIDGSRLLASSAGAVYSSADSGQTWVAMTNAPGNVMAASTSGTTLVAAVSGGGIYISSDAGASWRSTSATSNDWVSAACSADATRLIAATGSGSLLISTNAGATWVAGWPFGWDWSVASSAEGTKFVAAPLQGPTAEGCDTIYLSTNSGVSWNLTSAPCENWASVAMSADGTELVAATASAIFISRDIGATWSNTSAPSQGWTSVRLSSDGAKLVAAGFDAVYTSTDYGTTWAEASAPFAAWNSLTCSGDGSRIAGAGDGLVALLRSPAPAPLPPPLPGLSMSLSSTNARLSWLLPSSLFVLQENAELTSPNWVGVTNGPVLNFTNLHNEVTMPRLSGKSFYRLQQQ
jgi:hypothetical protein